MTGRGQQQGEGGHEGPVAEHRATSARRRPRASRHRIRRVHVRLSEPEFAALAHAAKSLGRTPAGFAAEAALAAARDEPIPQPNSTRQALLELMAARAQLRRYGNNVNQAVRALNATGEAPEWITNAVKLTNHVVDRIDAAVTDLSTPRRAP